MRHLKIPGLVIAAISLLLLTGCGGGSESNNNPTSLTYSVSFITNGGSSVTARSVQQGGAISTSPVTTREGYDFDGWFTDNYTFENNVSFPYIPTGNITLYAKWISIDELISGGNKAVLNDNIKILSQQDSETFINFAQPIGMVDNNLVITLPATLNLGLFVGDIFMARPTSGNPMGVTAKVEQINGNEITISQPAIDEVFKIINIDIEHKLSNSDIIGAWMADGVSVVDRNGTNIVPYDTRSFSAEGVTYLENEISIKSYIPLGELTFCFDEVLYDEDNNLETDNDQIRLIGEYGLTDMNIKVLLDVENTQKPIIETSSSLVAVANTTVKIGGKYEIGLDNFKTKYPIDETGWYLKGISNKNKVVLGRILYDLGTLMPIYTQSNDYFPTTLAAGLELTATLEGKVEGSFSIGSNFEMYMNTGFRVDHEGFKQIFEIKDNITGDSTPSIHSTIDAEVNLEAKALLGLDLVVYAAGVKLAAITNDFGLFANAEISAHVTDLNSGVFNGKGEISLKLVGNAFVCIKAGMELKWWEFSWREFKLVEKKRSVEIGYENEVELYNIPLWAKNIGVIAVTNGFDGRDYALYDITMTWHEARAYCECMRGHLATVTSVGEQEFIVSLLDRGSREYYWLGATDEDVEDVWKWVTSEQWNYTNWHIGEPNNDYYGTENYLGIWTKNNRRWTPYKWNDFTVDDPISHGFICEWSNRINETVSAIPSLIDFGSLQTTYTQPASRPVTIRNTGTGTVTLNEGSFTMTGGEISGNSSGVASHYYGITLGGTAVISGNGGINDRNVYLGLEEVAQYITLSATTPPAPGMNVSVSTPRGQGVIVQSGASAGQEAYFHADLYPLYTVVFEAPNKLAIR